MRRRECQAQLTLRAHQPQAFARRGPTDYERITCGVTSSGASCCAQSPSSTVPITPALIGNQVAGRGIYDMIDLDLFLERPSW